MNTGRKFAVFDIDGTLLRWQLFHGMINTLAKKGALGEGAHAKIQAARLRWKQRAHPEAFEEYQDLILQLYFDALTELPQQQYDDAVQKTIRQYKDQTYRYTTSLLKELKQQGYLLFAISGSQSELVERLAKYYGFDDWVGTQYERKDGGFTGNRAGAFKDKDVILKRLVKKHTASMTDSIAVGDTGGDIGMLAFVEKPIAFNPNRALFDHAVKHAWKIVIERKNVIYELHHNGHHYVLDI
jgi:HAD superfamily hydrolase (TIGR01490 family)